MDNDDRVIIMAVYDDQVTGWVRDLARGFGQLVDRVLGDAWRAVAAPPDPISHVATSAKPGG
ncbi:hypothetical protein GCM10009681_42480 [Luedemannella helvata]|uniref:Uncharacterized protein n=2 Tax=Luedemannella helvata TaxID=349315 RepID=A0ABN2KUV0_9ACTN